MIMYPPTWRTLGVPVTLEDLDKAMREVMRDLDSINLSFSGGLDSSLLLYYLLEIKGQASTFTVANDANHPDIEYSRRTLRYFETEYKVHIDHRVFIRPGIEGNDLVRAFYSALGPSVMNIIAGDGIDELACGYYGHQDMEERTYYDYLSRLQFEHLRPLNDNSGDTAVYLPYVDDRVAALFYRIPLYDKVSTTCRKIILTEWAMGKVPSEVIERKKYGFATQGFTVAPG